MFSLRLSGEDASSTAVTSGRRGWLPLDDNERPPGYVPSETLIWVAAISAWFGGLFMFGILAICGLIRG